MSWRWMLVVLAALALAGCGSGKAIPDEADEAQCVRGLPDGVSTCEVTTPNGTECIVVRDYGSGGTGVSCNWTSSSGPSDTMTVTTDNTEETA